MPFFTFNYQQVIDETIALDDLSNVTVPSPTDGSVLAYDSTSSAWLARDVLAGIDDSTRTYIHTYPRLLPSDVANIATNQMRFATFTAKYNVVLNRISIARVTDVIGGKAYGLITLNSSNQPVAINGNVYVNNRFYLPGGVEDTATVKTGVRFATSAHNGLVAGGKRFLCLYRVNLDSSNQITSLTLIGQTIDDPTIFDFDNVVSEKLFTSPVSITAGQTYAAGYLVTGEMKNPENLSAALNSRVKSYSINYATTISKVASATGVARFGVPPALIHHVGATDTQVVSGPPATIDGPNTPKLVSSRRRDGAAKISYITLNNVTNLYVGQRVVVTGVGNLWNTGANIVSIAGNEIGYSAFTSNSTSVSPTASSGSVVSSAMLNYKRTGSIYDANEYFMPWLRLEA